MPPRNVIQRGVVPSKFDRISPTSSSAKTGNICFSPRTLLAYSRRSLYICTRNATYRAPDLAFSDGIRIDRERSISRVLGSIALPAECKLRHAVCFPFLLPLLVLLPAPYHIFKIGKRDNSNWRYSTLLDVKLSL